MNNYVNDFILPLGIPCIITIVLELIVFILADYNKNRLFINLVIFTNITTNITLNFIINLWSEYFISSLSMIILLEIVVIVIEYKIYSIVEKPSKKLLITTIFANLTSLLIGQIIHILFIYPSNSSVKNILKYGPKGMYYNDWKI